MVNNEDITRSNLPEDDPKQVIWLGRMRLMKSLLEKLFSLLREKGGENWHNDFNNLKLKMFEEIKKRTKLSSSEVREYAIIHPLLGSTVNYQDYPKIDMPNDEIEAYINAKLDEEISRLENQL